MGRREIQLTPRCSPSVAQIRSVGRFCCTLSVLASVGDLCAVVMRWRSAPCAEHGPHIASTFVVSWFALSSLWQATSVRA